MSVECHAGGERNATERGRFLEKGEVRFESLTQWLQKRKTRKCRRTMTQEMVDDCES